MSINCYLPSLTLLLGLMETSLLSAQELIGTFTVNAYSNAGGCPPSQAPTAPTDGNPYQCQGPAPGPIIALMNAPAGEYRIKTKNVIVHPGNPRLWVGNADGGIGYYISGTIGTVFTFTAPAGANIVLYTYDWYAYDNDQNASTVIELYNNSCQVNACGDTSNPSAVGCVRAFSFDVAYERAEFIPRSDLSLETAARACGFRSFNWQQSITTLPCGSQFRPADPSKIAPVNLCQDGSLTATPSTPFSDPPPGSYTYMSNDPYPFVYPSSFVLPNSDQCSLPGYCPPFPLIATDTALSFVDGPNNPALPGVPASPNPPAGSYMAFSSALVGVLVNNNGQETVSPPLFSWTWNSTYNGRTVASGVSQTASVYPLVPGSGTGGVTITSVNGITQTPPSVSCSATPNDLWPPNGKAFVVRVSGIITPGTSSLVSGGTTYSVLDEYGQIQPSGGVVLGAGGSYSFGVSLIAARNGNDQDGRRYTVVVSGKDAVGNVGSCPAVVTVPHDQRH